MNCGDAPLGLTKELLSAEGFADIRYVYNQGGSCIHSGVLAR